MCTFCFSLFTTDFFCFFASTAGFLLHLAFCGADHSRRSRTIPVYFCKLIRADTTAQTVIPSASARMWFTFTRFCSPLHDLSIHTIKASFFLRGMFYATNDCRLKRFCTLNTVSFSTYSCAPHARVDACVQARRALLLITTVPRYVLLLLCFSIACVNNHFSIRVRVRVWYYFIIRDRYMK